MENPWFPVPKNDLEMVGFPHLVQPAGFPHLPFSPDGAGEKCFSFCWNRCSREKKFGDGSKLDHFGHQEKSNWIGVVTKHNSLDLMKTMFFCFPNGNSITWGTYIYIIYIYIVWFLKQVDLV